ncbi:MAG: S9 family peptidase [Candidatus Neomarinimicrobiota bacterium]
MISLKQKKKPFEITTHGDTRIDDYYWMRLTDDQKSKKEPDLQTKKVVDYIDLENEYTNENLAHTKPLQEKLFKEITGRIKKDDSSVPYFENGYYYYYRYEKDKEYAVYCRKKGSLDSVEEVYLDENELADGHDYFAIGGMSISPNNAWLAYGVDTLSRRFYEIFFKNLKTGEIIKETIPNTTGYVAWANDNKTIFYTSKNQVTLLSEKIFRHSLRSDFKKDVLVYHEKDDSFYIGVQRSKSGEYIIIYNSSTLVSDYHILKADNPFEKFKNFSPRGTEHEYDISHYKDKFYILTNLNAKNKRLMETNEDKTEISNWKEVIPHDDKIHLLSMRIFQNHIVINERKDGLRGLKIINQNSGKSHRMSFDEDSYSARFSINEEFKTNILRYNYNSMTTPRSTYDYNMDTGEQILMKQQEVVGGYDQNLYLSERIYVEARDGNLIPVSMVYRKDKKTDVPQNLLLYAYGSYGSTMDPYFSSTRLSLLDRGFIFAIAHVRGSQIYGRKSYEDGKLLNKKNTFYDFIDVGKYLIKNDYTDSNSLFCQGASAGGLLIGAVVNMEPSIWKGALAGVPFVDAVTTMLDPSIPLTSNEWDEWGDPREKEYYDYMLSYSPYDQVRKIKYPNMLVTSGFFDSQVQYWEPLKWVAKLRDHWITDNQLLLKMNMDAGHGGKSGRFIRYKEYALEYAWMLDLAGIKE